MIKWFKEHVLAGLSVVTGIITLLIVLIGYLTDVEVWVIDQYKADKDHEQVHETVSELEARIALFEDSAITTYLPLFQSILAEAPKIPANDFRSRITLDVLKGTLKDSVINGIRFKCDNYNRLWYFKNGFVYSAYYEAESRKYLYRDMNDNLKICQ